MEELIVDDIPIFARVFQKSPCLLLRIFFWFGLFVLAQKVLQKFAATSSFKLSIGISICVHIRWLTWWRGWEKECFPAKTAPAHPPAGAICRGDAITEHEHNVMDER